MHIKNTAKPFLKWAGGKSQLIDQIKQNLPEKLYNEKFTYIEPFVGSGAVFFWIINHFPNVEKIIINDINVDLINTYTAIKNHTHQLIMSLEKTQNEYHSLENNQEKQKEYYYQKRELYNSRKSDKIEQATLFIFLNRTCFNATCQWGVIKNRRFVTEKIFWR